jgi:hypothetical protein
VPIRTATIAPWPQSTEIGLFGFFSAAPKEAVQVHTPPALQGDVAGLRTKLTGTLLCFGDEVNSLLYQFSVRMRGTCYRFETEPLKQTLLLLVAHSGIRSSSFRQDLAEGPCCLWLPCCHRQREECRRHIACNQVRSCGKGEKKSFHQLPLVLCEGQLIAIYTLCFVAVLHADGNLCSRWQAHKSLNAFRQTVY